MTRSTRTLLTVAVAAPLAVAGMTTYAPAWAQSDVHTTVLRAGQSIQAAIDAAAPGTTIVLKRGTYQGNLTITKTVALRGDGSVVVEPAATVTHNACTDDPSLPAPEIPGICIGQIGPNETIINTVADVTLSGFEIKGFSGQGVFAAGTSRLRIDDLDVDHNGDGGLFADLSDHVTIASNRVHDNANTGMHLSSDHVVTAVDNRSYRNDGEGILFADSSGGRIDDNHLSGNCVGLVAVDTGFDGVVNDVRITDNIVEGNDRYCPGDPSPGGRPPQGGLGVALAGTTNTVVSGNRIIDNDLASLPAGADAPLVQAGFALVDSTPFGGRTPADNRIVGNTIRNNNPLDVVTDGSGTGNIFRDNRCATASTPGICR